MTPQTRPTACEDSSERGAVCDNSLAIAITAGVFEPFRVTLRLEIGAISMSGSSVLVALNALSLRRLSLRDSRRLAR